MASHDSAREIAGARARRIGLTALLTWGILAAGGLFALQVNFEENVLTAPWQKEIRADVVAIVPERWAFFTKSPRDETMTAYARESDGQWRETTGFPRAQPQHAFGMSRTVRAAGIELGLLQMNASGQEWQDCNTGESANTCIEGVAATETPVAVSNPTPEPLLCGDIALVGETPAPWAYAHIGQGAPTLRVALLEVAC